MAAISVSICGRSAQMCEMRRGKPHYLLINQVRGVETVELSFSFTGVLPHGAVLTPTGTPRVKFKAVNQDESRKVSLDVMWCETLLG